MRSAEIRQSFVEFFAGRGHRVWPSSPLVPHGDPTLLFTNAGMVQFKDYFLGARRPDARRAVSVQKCLRVSGKHNDLENVGPSPRHHTFFEMLGNFSFGDYFKAEAIELGWELVTRVWGLDPETLAVTVFREDDEAAELWRRIAGLPAERIHRCGAEDNFWAMGETGPCGPCSEIYVDRAPAEPEVGWEEGTASGRYLEIWNLVFMQYDRAADGTLVALPNPSIDTGAGLERVAAVLGGVESNYDTDLFQPLLRAAAELAGTRYGAAAEHDVSLRVVADHLRAVAFLLADGVIPGNEGRGYVLRRLLRRAVRHGMRLGFEEPFLHRLLPELREVMGAAYPELGATERGSRGAVRAEEEKFLATVAAGSRLVQEAIEEARRGGAAALAGEVAFRLYDTHGVPLELIHEIAEEERLAVDDAGFERALAGQRERSREATGDAPKVLADLQQVLRTADIAPTEFVGYDALEVRAPRVGALLGWQEGEPGKALGTAERLRPGEAGWVVVERTPFYAEAGGQVGDRGEIAWDGGGRAEILDTLKTTTGIILHRARVEAGALERGLPVVLRVDEDRRRSTQRNHTATHLLHAALRRGLGDGVRQAGSLVAPDHLRFDFTHGQGLRPEERTAVEDLVNEWIRRAVEVRVEWRGFQEAVEAGAMALFGEKYGERVRTVGVPGFSLELCGGCHVRNTGEIGLFLITAERGIASGVRRIEALTGEGALAQVRRREALLAEVERQAGAPAERAAAEVAALRDRLREVERELARLRLRAVTEGGGGGARSEAVTEVAGVKVIAREVPPAPAEELRNMADVLRARLGTGVVVLGSRADGKVSLVAAVSPDLASRVPAGELVRRIAPIVGGRGGGRPDFAQAGGREPEKLDEALAAVAEAVRQSLDRL